jgi:repressor LexA
VGTPKGPRPLTARQAQVLEAIKAYRAFRGYPPSLRDVAKVAGINVTTVYRHVLALQRKKRLLRVPGIPRTLVVIDEEPAQQTTARR